MRWIRTHRHAGAYLALFALALQLVLSFGHLHHSEFAFAGSSTTITAGPADDGGLPDPDGRAGKHDLCAICATITLAASTVLPGQATLPLPFASGRTLVFELQTDRLVFQAHRFFRARAPPVIT